MILLVSMRAANKPCPRWGTISGGEYRVVGEGDVRRPQGKVA
jgi:hypothetical protein